jgi:hypothetical protein
MNHTIIGMALQWEALGAIRHKTDDRKSRGRKTWNFGNAWKAVMHSMVSMYSMISTAWRGLYKRGLMPE